MGWLKEAVERAFQQRQTNGIEKARKNAALPTREVKKVVSKNERQERLELLHSSGVRALLEEVKREVWHGGKIKDKSDTYFDPTISLEHRYTRVVFQTGKFGGIGGHREEPQIEELTIALERHYGKTGDPVVLRFVLCGCIPPEYVPFADENAIETIKDFLRRDSVARILNHCLPKDLKSERKSERLR